MTRATWGRLAAKCPACRDPQARVAFGCDAPAPEPVLRVTCPLCDGFAPSCGACGGTGRAPVLRCPAQHNTAEVAAAIRAVGLLERGVLPARGAWLDQAAGFDRVVREVQRERDAMEHDEAERDRRIEELGRAHGHG